MWYVSTYIIYVFDNINIISVSHLTLIVSAASIEFRFFSTAKFSPIYRHTHSISKNTFGSTFTNSFPVERKSNSYLFPMKFESPAIITNINVLPGRYEQNVSTITCLMESPGYHAPIPSQLHSNLPDSYQKSFMETDHDECPSCGGFSPETSARKRLRAS